MDAIVLVNKRGVASVRSISGGDSIHAYVRTLSIDPDADDLIDAICDELLHESSLGQKYKSCDLY